MADYKGDPLMGSYTDLPRIGDMFKNDCLVKTFVAKTEANKTKTNIKPGDPVIMNGKTGETDCGVIEKATASNLKTNTLVGFATHGIVGYYVPIILRGHFITAIDSSVFTGSTDVGHQISCGDGATKCARGHLVSKIKVQDPTKKPGVSKDAFVTYLK